MKTRQKLIESIENFHKLGAMIPGNVYSNYNVCGKPGCICKDPVNPQKHGPYSQVSFTLGRKSYNRKVDSMDFDKMTGMNGEWKKLRELEKSIALLSLDLIREEGMDALEEVYQQTSVESKLAEKDAEIEHLKKQLEEERKRSESWKERAAGHADKLAAQRARIRDLETSRENWKGKTRAAKQQINELCAKKKDSEVEVVQTENIPEHSYDALRVFQCIAMVIKALCSLRGASICFEIFYPEAERIPCYTTIRNWFHKVGLSIIQSPVPVRDDWIFICDHTISFGQWKLFLLLAVSRESLRGERAMPTHHDAYVVDFELCKSSNGDIILQKLSEAADRVGMPIQLIGDGGSDIQRGYRMFVEQNPGVRSVYDVTHKAATILKSELSEDESWQQFSTLCGEIKRTVNQSASAFLSPPKPVDKCREMNFSRYVNWGADMLELLDLPELHRLTAPTFQINTAFFEYTENKGLDNLRSLLGHLESNTYNSESEFLDEIRKSIQFKEVGKQQTLEAILTEGADTGRQLLEKHFGKLEGYADNMGKWQALIDILKTLNTELKQGGLNLTSIAKCREKIKTQTHPSLIGAKQKIFNYLEELSAGLSADDFYLASSDIIESLFGKLKNFVRKAPLKEIGKNILLLPLFVTELTCDMVDQALQKVRMADVDEWFEENVPQSIFSKRRKAFKMLPQ